MNVQTQARQILASKACVACKKRKIKCCGNPCSYCIKKNVQCVFGDSKKRGPPKEKDVLLELQKNLVINSTQQHLVNMYGQNDIVEFYFDNFGLALLPEFQQPLKSPIPSDNIAMQAQLCLIIAHTCRGLGHMDTSEKYYDAAQKMTTQIFTAFNIESVVALVMMTLYLEEGGPQSWFYASTACNILKVLNMQDTTFSLAANCLAIAKDPHMDRTTRTNLMLNILPTNLDLISPRHRAMVGMVRVEIHEQSLLQVNHTTAALFLESFVVAPPITEEAAVLFSEHIAQLELLDATCGDELSTWRSTLLLRTALFRFTLAWRSGKLVEALAFASQSLTLYKSNPHILLLRLRKNTLWRLFLIPLFLDLNGVREKATEAFVLIQQVLSAQGRAGVFKEMCAEMQFDLSTVSYSLLEAEEELLGSLICFSPESLIPSFEESNSLSLIPL